MLRPALRPKARSSLAATAVIVAVALGGQGSAAAQEAPQPPPPPAVSEHQQALTNQADVLRAEATAVRDQAVRLRAELTLQQRRVAEANAASDAATTALADARVGRAEAERDLAEQRRRTKQLAANAYIRGPAPVDLILRSESINDAVRLQSMAAAAGESKARVLRDLDRAEKAAAEAERVATRLAEESAASAVSAQAHAERLAQQQARQTMLLSAVNDRLEHTLAEAAALADIDAVAAGTVANRDAALQEIVPTLPAIPALRPALPAIATTTVGTIRVSNALAAQVQALLVGAAQAGFALGGGGFRDPASQIALRVLHCGATDYDIYEKPSGECSPPTARPGTSMHERGLAIDFTVNGKAIVSEADPAFQWLAANAPSYGLYNLPGEPWHWSITGS
jgi:hypothetical protein